ncbi:MAG: DUF547 domain-containing protein [Porphyrobacter sp.]|nr:DUF547 domain-containing protein [Porphyrobacter sp.]
MFWWSAMTAQKWAIAVIAAAGLALPGQAARAAPPPAAPPAAQDALARFAPRPDGRDLRLDYSVWTEALAAFVVSMGPPLRKVPLGVAAPPGTRLKLGPNSFYRLDGSMIGFTLIDREVLANIARYRGELQAVADTIDIQALPRNEQLAYWLNLHNVAMVEKIGENWPIRQPRDIVVDGVPLEEARFVTVQGIALSPRDIRERIVYAHWRSPEVIYGFWRGEIGGPAIQRAAFDGRDVASQLDMAAREFVNSRRGTEKRGNTMHVSRLYTEAAPFYFPDFERGLRAHLARHVEGKMAASLGQTSMIEATIYEHDIADLSGGARSNPFFASGRLDAGVARILAERARKFDYMRRERIPTYTVTFSNITLPGDPPTKGEVE